MNKILLIKFSIFNPHILMFSSLNELKITNCSNFLDKLSIFEENLQSNEFGNVLNDLHCSFLALCASFEIQFIEPKIDIEKPNEFGIQKLKVNQFTLLLYNEKVLDIEEKYHELAFLFVNKSKDDAIKQASMLFDYDTRYCDFCGLYFRKPGFLPPVYRKEKSDFILAYHLNCFNDLD